MLQIIRDKKIALYFLGSLVLGFLLLILYVHLLPTSWIDTEFSEEIQEHRNPLLDTLMKLVSWFGTRWIAVTMVCASALIFLVFTYRREAMFLIISQVSSVITYGIKVAVDRPRPTEELVQIIQKAQHQSFPSGHTVFYVVFFGFLAFLMYRLRQIPDVIRILVAGLSLLLIFSVPFSRVYLGDHWLTDVLGGIFLGLLLLSALIYGYLRKSD